jgi:NAD(P)-dependent dehydrogenase (short-subunit alcohol dehydrogenase family)
MQIEGSVALVTGANRGLGHAIARALVEGGAAKVYAAARDPQTVTDPGLVPVALDVTDHAQVAAVAAELTDVDLVVNNAGVASVAFALTADLEQARRELEVNYLGTLAVAQAFAPVLKANGGGALVNVLSVVSFVSQAHLTTYSASKAAQWSITNALRVALREQGTLVTGVHVGYIDTDLAAGIDAEKHAPADVAAAILDGVRNGAEEVLVDELSRTVKAALPDDQRLLYAAG